MTKPIEKIFVRGHGRFIAQVNSSRKPWGGSFEVVVIEPIGENGPERRLGMRWQGSGKGGHGYPMSSAQSNGFEIDEDLEIAVLSGLGLTTERLEQALGYLNGEEPK